MNRLEDIRKILELVKTNECSVGRATHQICSLFEPKPDESRLLDEDEILDIWTKNKEDCGMVTDFARKIMSKTASIVRVEAIREVGELMIGRGTVGMEALPKWEQGFWKGYWQALIDKGESLQKGECLEDTA